MWKDNDFRDLFANYSVTPPQKVWNDLAYILENNRKQKGITPYFSPSQKLALAVACLSSVLLCSFMLRFIEELPDNHLSFQTNYDSKQSHHSFNESKTFVDSVQSSHTLPIVQSRISPSAKNVQAHQVRISEEYKPFEKEILALADLDRQIAELGEEIQTLKTAEPLPNEWSAPTLAHMQTKTEATTHSNWMKYRNQLKEDAIPELNESKLTDAVIFRPKFMERFYLTPYMGANYTQVFYQDKPASNFFSDKAKFSGQIGYNAGVQVGFQLNKKWSVESGIGLGQYILGFKEDYGTHFRDGNMYIDQLDIPFLIRYSLDLNKKKLPLSLAFKGGFIYSSVIFYQVNYTDKFSRILPVNTPFEKSFSFDVDKSQYNSLQFGYAAGLDLDAYLSRKIAFNFSALNTLVSQLNNFPFFSTERQRPIQFSTSFSIGTKIRF